MDRPPPPPPASVAAVLLFSRDPAALAEFHRRHFGLPLRPVSVPGLSPHFACDVGHVYVSIWPAGGPDGAPAAPGAAGLALQVADLAAAHARLVADGVPCLFPPRRTAVGLLARYRDPDGNLLELLQVLR